LIYTTHSPFLINRNFPRRLRLVRKGDGEEGTVLVDEERVRRYEPVRSALGIDCAQTMFMGATNLVLEGPVDQYLFCELVRIFSDRSNVHTLLDLNDVVVVSAESASRVGKLLESSLWEDESNPAVVVLLDSDEGGNEALKQITGQSRNAKKRIDSAFVKQIGVLVGPTIAGQQIVTSEDLLPPSVYRQAIKNYVAKFTPEWNSRTTQLDEDAFGCDGVEAGTKAFFRAAEGRDSGSFDKLGVAEAAIAIVSARFEADSKDSDVQEIKRRLVQLCAGLRDAIAESRGIQRSESTRQALVRHVTVFRSQHHEGSTLFDLQTLLKRLGAELEALGKEGLTLTDRLQVWKEEILAARRAGDDRVSVDAWKWTTDALKKLHHDPFSHDLPASLITVPPTQTSPAPESALAGTDGTPRPLANPAEPAAGEKDEVAPETASAS
jgi:hypothetical protein